MPLELATRRALLQVARESIQRRLTGNRIEPSPETDDAALAEPRASFVTLKRRHALRGCIGSLEAHRSLLQDVIHNARAAAFHDPRFNPLSLVELPEVEIEISVLSPPVPLPVKSRAELLQKLEPGRHGLILQEGGRRATFLPTVWETLVAPEHFVAELLQKAGLARNHWSDTLDCSTYTTESFAEHDR